MALPEGVLADGGRVAGFIYFEEATRRERALVLRATLEPEAQPGDDTGADTGAPGGTPAEIEIPFVIR
jgi:hypothetical protein